MLMRRPAAQRGDTLIEVIFSIAIFSMIMVGAILLMNQGSAAAQRSLEISLVRQQIDGQAETLRYLHDSYVAAYKPGVPPSDPNSAAGKWASLRSQGFVSTTAATDFTITGTSCPVISDNRRAFITDPATATYTTAAAALQPAQSYAMIDRSPTGSFIASRGMWIEAVRSTTDIDGVGYIDFHIRACWAGIGTATPMTIGTIVRLYDK